jgi:hypothetical protein
MPADDMKSTGHFALRARCRLAVSFAREHESARAPPRCTVARVVPPHRKRAQTFVQEYDERRGKRVPHFDPRVFDFERCGRRWQAAPHLALAIPPGTARWSRRILGH